MPNQSTALDRVFSALSDPTRRAVLTQLTQKSASVSELAEPFGMALPSFTQHLKVLEECGLVRTHKEGRVRIVQLVPKQLDVAERWLEKQRSLWRQRLDALDRTLIELSQQPPEETQS